MNPNHEESSPVREVNPRWENAENPENAREENPFRSCEMKDALRDLGDAFKGAFRAGAEDARNSARDAIPKAKEQFARGLHDIAYGLAYAVSFGGAVARELTPESIAAGFEEGREAGLRAAETVIQRTRKEPETAGAASPDPEAVSVGGAEQGGGEPVMI